MIRAVTFTLLQLMARKAECLRRASQPTRPMRSLAIIFIVIALPARAQQGATLSKGYQFSGTGQPSQVFSDQFSNSCSSGSQNPYAGMNPLICKGVQGPADTAGRCSLKGMRLLHQYGNTCYYCQPLNPPIQGIIVPMDQLGPANQQGFRCGIDEADPKCYAVCMGGRRYVPPSQSPPTSTGRQAAGGCTPPDNLSIADRARWYQENVLSGRVRCKGAYDPCDNPSAPAWCTDKGQTVYTGEPARPGAAGQAGNGGPGDPGGREASTDTCQEKPPETGTDRITGQLLSAEWEQWCLAWQELFTAKVVDTLSKKYGARFYKDYKQIYFQFRATAVQYRSDGLFGLEGGRAVGQYPKEYMQLQSEFDSDAWAALRSLQSDLNNSPKTREKLKFPAGSQYSPKSKNQTTTIGFPGQLPCTFLIYIRPPSNLKDAGCPYPEPGSSSDTSSPFNERNF